jgi:hypothetical protein
VRVSSVQDGSARRRTMVTTSGVPRLRRGATHRAQSMTTAHRVVLRPLHHRVQERVARLLVARGADRANSEHREVRAGDSNDTTGQSGPRPRQALRDQKTRPLYLALTAEVLRARFPIRLQIGRDEGNSQRADRRHDVRACRVIRRSTRRPTPEGP